MKTFLCLFCFVPALTCALWFTICKIYKHKHSPLTFKSKDTTVICASAHRSSAIPVISQIRGWPSVKQSCKTQQHWALSARIAFAVCLCLSKLSNKCEPGFKPGFRGNWLVSIRALMSMALEQWQAKKSQAQWSKLAYHIKSSKCVLFSRRDLMQCLSLRSCCWTFVFRGQLRVDCSHARVILFKLTSDWKLDSVSNLWNTLLGCWYLIVAILRTIIQLGIFGCAVKPGWTRESRWWMAKIFQCRIW